MRTALLACLMATTLLAACDNPQTTETRSYDVTGAVAAVAISSHGGRITVTAGSGDTVHVTETVRYSGSRPEPRHRLDGAELTFTSGCQGHGGSCGVDYEVRVPATVKATLDSGGGDITVGGLSGDLDVSTGGGAVAATGISAPILNARTGGGVSHLAFAAAPGTVRVDSGGGDVTVRLPKERYAVDADANGGATTVGVTVDPASTRTIDVDTGGGDVVVNYS